MEDAIVLLRRDVNAFNKWRHENPSVTLDLGAQDLQGLDLSGAVLSGAELRDANFSGALMMGAVFSGADVEGARFDGADLTGAIFGVLEKYPEYLQDTALGMSLGHPANASRASFVRATLTQTQFREVRVDGADFTDANHAEADLEGASTEGALLPEANKTLEERAWRSLRALSFEQKRSYIQSLYTIACVDGVFDEDEQALMFALSERLALTPSEFEACIPTEAFSPQDIRIDAPQDLEVRIQWLRDLLMMIAADGALETAEYQTCLFFAAQLGFPEDVVENVLASMVEEDA